jgi:GH15 family glucan-1,4-alpha-glucosidase
MRRSIEDYALLSDLQSAALIHRRDSIDWCCLPRFDSEACFAGLLGEPEHGRWIVAPVASGELTRRYRDGSLVLETEWDTGEGRMRVVDEMPPRGAAPAIVRIVKGLAGRVRVRSELVVRFSYGRIVPSQRRLDGGEWVATAGPEAIALHTTAETVAENRATVSAFDAGAGERVPFALLWFASHAPRPAAIDPDEALGEATRFWGEWSSRCRYSGPYRDAVLQSLVVLKGLAYLPTGGIVAAPTTSLPEWPGGERNWDYWRPLVCRRDLCEGRRPLAVPVPGGGSAWAGYRRDGFAAPQRGRGAGVLHDGTARWTDAMRGDHGPGAGLSPRGGGGRAVRATGDRPLRQQHD